MACSHRTNAFSADIYIILDVLVSAVKLTSQHEYELRNVTGRYGCLQGLGAIQSLHLKPLAFLAHNIRIPQVLYLIHGSCHGM